MPANPPIPSIVTPEVALTVQQDPQERLRMVVELCRQISSMTDPQEVVTVFRQRARMIYGGTGSISVSRRNLREPQYRITRSTKWEQEVNPWHQADQLPLLEGGVLADLVYGDRPAVIPNFRIDESDPAFEHLYDARAVVALPQYDGGVGLNMVVRYSADPHEFDRIKLPEAVLDTNLFGRATMGLLTAQKLRAANALLDHELKSVARIQRSLLPATLPDIPGIDMAVSYQTAARAGGDYYDFFDLGGGRWGIMIADVSGHGTPAAVLMAVLRTLLHAFCHRNKKPSEVLCYADRGLCDRAGDLEGAFVTAFYGVYDSNHGTLEYTCAGHNPPVVVEKSLAVRELDEAQGLPMCVLPDARFDNTTTKLNAGDTLVMYTDGITEATNAVGEMYGRDRLLHCVHEHVPNAQHIIDCVVHRLLAFTGEREVQDDRTLVALRVQ